MNHAANTFNHLVITCLAFWLILMVIAVVFAIAINWYSERQRPRDTPPDPDDSDDSDEG